MNGHDLNLNIQNAQLQNKDISVVIRFWGDKKRALKPGNNFIYLVWFTYTPDWSQDIAIY